MRRPVLLADLWLGALALFITAVLVAPAAALLVNSIAAGGGPTLEVYRRLLTTRSYQQSIVTSVLLAATSASLGTLAGALVALSLHYGVGERARGSAMAIATVATNYGGVPLAFGFIVLLGSQGMLTLMLRSVAGDAVSVELVSFWGLVTVYLYFLVPLCVLTFFPYLSALRPEYREAASVHGASAFQFWRRVGGPIVLPPLLASFVLQFASALGSFTTPWALVGGGSGLRLMTLEVAFLFGEVGYDLEAADALAVLIILISAGSLVSYHLLLRRAARWLG